MTGRPDAPEVHRFDEPHRDINGKRWYNGVGNPNADILFVDNWPGDEIKRTNRPLADRTGKCLQWLLRLAGIDPRRCYYTYAVKYPFGAGRKPSGVDKAACATMLREEIEAVSPKVVVAFGSDAWAAVAGAHSAPATRQMTDDDRHAIRAEIAMARFKGPDNPFTGEVDSYGVQLRKRGYFEIANEVTDEEIQAHWTASRSKAAAAAPIARIYPFACCRGEPVVTDTAKTLFPTYNLAQVMMNGGEGYKDRLALSDIPPHVLVHQAVRELKLVKRIADGEDLKATYAAHRPTYDVLTTPEDVDFVHEQVMAMVDGRRVADGLLCLDCEWDGRNWLDPDRYIRTVQIGYAKGRVAIVKLHEEGGLPSHPDTQAVMAAVKRWLEDPRCGIVGHNVIADGEWLLQEGIDIRPRVVYDTMLGGYLLCEDGPFGLEEAAMRYAPYGRYCSELECWVKRHGKECKLGFGNVPDRILLPYGAADVDCLRYIMEGQLPELEKLGYLKPRGVGGEYPSMLQTTLNTQRVIYEIERTGLPVDRQRLDELIDAFQAKKAELLSQVVLGAAQAGMPDFNPGSSAQVRELLFKKLGLAPVKTTAGKDWAEAVGNWGMDEDMDESPGTDKQTLEILGDAHPLVKTLLQYRRLEQPCKTWLRHKDENNKDRGLEAQLWADGRLHSHMSQLSTTSRFKSSAPNAQNFPKKAEGFMAEIFGKDNIPPVIRTIVVPPPGMVMMEADFQQAELFTIASLSGDPHMIDMLKTPGRDMHTSISAKAFGYHMFDENNKEWTEDDVVELVRTQYGGDAENKEFKTWQKHLVFRDAHGNELTYAQYKAGPRISGKNVNFGILYGRGGRDTAIQVKAETGAAESIDVLAAQLDQVIKTWKEVEYPVAWAFIESCMAKVYDPGFIKNPFGRIRRAPFLLRGQRDAGAERNFANFPIQSTVSDAVQLAMDKMQAWRVEHGLHFEIQNQIHDAVMLHVPKDEIEETKYMFHHTLGDIHIPLGPDKYFTLGVDIDVYERWGQKVKE